MKNYFKLIASLLTVIIGLSFTSCSLLEEEDSGKSSSTKADVRFWYDYTNVSDEIAIAIALEDEAGDVTDTYNYTYTLSSEWITVKNSEMSEYFEVDKSSDYYILVDNDADGEVDQSAKLGDNINGGGSYTIKVNATYYASLYNDSDTTWGARVRFTNDSGSNQWFGIGSGTTLADELSYQSVSDGETSKAYDIIDAGDYYILYKYALTNSATASDVQFTFDKDTYYTVTLSTTGFTVTED